MKEYYNDITRENLELIKTHREKLLTIKDNTRANEILVRKLKETLKDLTPQLQKAQSEKEKLEREVETLDKDTMALRNAKGYHKEIQ